MPRSSSIHADSRHGSAVLYAGFYQFAPGQRLRWPRVHSRMLLWCREGRGNVRVDGAAPIAMTPDDILFTPWRHDIEYRADARDPFFLVGVHIVPRYASRGPHAWAVSHVPGDDYENLRGRADALLGEIDRMSPMRSNPGEPLRLAAEYVLAAFLRDDDSTRRIDDARAWAGMLIREMRAAMKPRARPSESNASLPPALRQIVGFIESNPANIDGIERLAQVAHLSRSTVERLFRRHLNVSPLEFLTERRVRLAKTLLTSSRLPINEIAVRVGIDDPFYFSKLFRAHAGRPPREYRRAARLL